MTKWNRLLMLKQRYKKKKSKALPKACPRVNPVTALYALFDPLTPQELRYIGITTVPPATRLKQHLEESKSSHYTKKQKSEWIASCLELGQTPMIRVLAWIETRGAGLIEAKAIKTYKRDGHRLTNSPSSGFYGVGFEAYDTIVLGVPVSPPTSEELRTLHIGVNSFGQSNQSPS